MNKSDVSFSRFSKYCRALAFAMAVVAPARALAARALVTRRAVVAPARAVAAARGSMVAAVVFMAATLLALAVWPAAVFADDRYYEITSYKTDVSIQTDGSAVIEERISYDFYGQFNGGLRDIDYSQTAGISNVEVLTAIPGEGDVTCVRDDTGNPQTYQLAFNNEIASFKVFSPTDDSSKTFIYRYTLLDACTKYTDIGEFYRIIIDNGWDTIISNVAITIRVPEGAAKEDLKVFAHGPLTGTSTIVDSRTFDFKVPMLPSNTFVETRVLFPTALIPQSVNMENKEALPEILAEEGKLADDANKQRDEAQREIESQKALRNRLAAIGNVLAIILILGWLPLLLYIYFKYDREFKHGFDAKYYRELPGTYTPAEASALMSFGKVAAKDILATMMDLVRRRHLVMTTQKTYKAGFFGGKEIIDYTFSYNAQPPQEQLKSHEVFLSSWLLGKIGDGRSVTLDCISDYARQGRLQALQFKTDYDAWCRLVRTEAKRNGFYDKTSKKGRLIGSLSGLGYAAAGFFIPLMLATPLAMLMIPLGIVLLIFSVRINRRSAYGTEQHAMWNAFKRFLTDFSNMKRAVIPSIVIWEHYLVYAISLGVAHDVIRQLPLVFPEQELNDRNLTFLHGSSFGYFAGLNHMFDNTIRTVESSVITATNIANSARSSGSGGGGGFSGGGGGGGGGRGGGGAF